MARRGVADQGVAGQVRPVPVQRWRRLVKLAIVLVRSSAEGGVLFALSRRSPVLWIHPLWDEPALSADGVG
jgi:hypothetical protein